MKLIKIQEHKIGMAKVEQLCMCLRCMKSTIVYRISMCKE